MKIINFLSLFLLVAVSAQLAAMRTATKESSESQVIDPGNNIKKALLCITQGQYVQAHFNYFLAFHQTLDPSAQAEAAVGIAGLYYKGLGIWGIEGIIEGANISEAIRYYGFAMNQNINLRAKAHALSNLGFICLKMPNAPAIIHTFAFDLFQQAANQDYDLPSKGYAWLGLAHIYYAGVGKAKDAGKAYDYLMMAFNQNFSREIKEKAQEGLTLCEYDTNNSVHSSDASEESSSGNA